MKLTLEVDIPEEIIEKAEKFATEAKAKNAMMYKDVTAKTIIQSAVSTYSTEEAYNGQDLSGYFTQALAFARLKLGIF